MGPSVGWNGAARQHFIRIPTEYKIRSSNYNSIKGLRKEASLTIQYDLEGNYLITTHEGREEVWSAPCIPN